MAKCIQSLPFLRQPPFWYATKPNAPRSFDAIQQIIYAIFYNIGLSIQSIIRGILNETLRGAYIPVISFCF